MRPGDLHQLGNATCHDYMWPYLLRYPGLVVLHDAVLHHSRARALLARNRQQDFRAEFAYAHPEAAGVAEFGVAGLSGTPYFLWPMTRVAVEAARLVSVHTAGLAELLRGAHPGCAIRAVRMGVPEPEDAPAPRGDGPVFACFGRVTPEKRIPPGSARFRVAPSDRAGRASGPCRGGHRLLRRASRCAPMGPRREAHYFGFRTGRGARRLDPGRRRLSVSALADGARNVSLVATLPGGRQADGDDRPRATPRMCRSSIPATGPSPTPAAMPRRWRRALEAGTRWPWRSTSSTRTTRSISRARDWRPTLRSGLSWAAMPMRGGAATR